MNVMLGLAQENPYLLQKTHRSGQFMERKMRPQMRHLHDVQGEHQAQKHEMHAYIPKGYHHKKDNGERHVHYVKMLVEGHLVDPRRILVMPLKAFGEYADGGKFQRTRVVENDVQESTYQIRG